MLCVVVLSLDCRPVLYQLCTLYSGRCLLRVYSEWDGIQSLTGHHSDRSHFSMESTDHVLKVVTRFLLE